jgi:pimeloyl-ACP methyl ester carboxylesterase
MEFEHSKNIYRIKQEVKLEMEDYMNRVISKDGTEIAYETKGSGKAVILVDGAICYRNFGPMGHLSDLLAPSFKVYIYDRRGRGESTNSKPYTVEREIEDLDALIKEAGGSAYIYGISSGACLALETAIALGDKVSKLALYEPPYNSMIDELPQWKDYRCKLSELISMHQHGDAVSLFMQFVGTPPDQVNGMRQAPMWPMFEAVAPTLVFDAATMGDDRIAPLDRASKIRVPALVMDGGADQQSRPFMHPTATSLAKAIPHSQQRTLEGQTHDVNTEVLAPILVDFFTKS